MFLKRSINSISIHLAKYLSSFYQTGHCGNIKIMRNHMNLKNFILSCHHIFLFIVGIYSEEMFVQTIESKDVDLHQILKPFERINCYDILRNYWNLDYAHTNKIPFVAQYFMLIKHYIGHQMEPFWVTSKFCLNNESNILRPEQDMRTCSSKYFVDKLNTNSKSPQIAIQCFSINMTRWSTIGRRGNCKITLDYVMPPFLDVKGVPQPTRYPISEYSITKSAPLFPEISLCVLCPENILKQWMAAVLNIRRDSIMVKNILFFFVTK